MIKKIEVDGEEISLKKSLGVWKVVYPLKKDPNQKLSWKNMHWFNFITGGSWKNLIWNIIMLTFLCLVIWSYFHDVATYQNCFNSYEALEVCKKSFGNFSQLNISNIKIIP